MEYLRDFDVGFGSEADLAYHQKTIDQINMNRRLLENELFFDKLLRAIGITQGMNPMDVAHTMSKVNSSPSLSSTFKSRFTKSLRPDHQN